MLSATDFNTRRMPEDFVSARNGRIARRMRRLRTAPSPPAETRQISKTVKSAMHRSNRFTQSRRNLPSPNAKDFNDTSSAKQTANAKSTRFKVRSRRFSIPGRSSAITTQESPIKSNMTRSKAACFTRSYAASRHLWCGGTQPHDHSARSAALLARFECDTIVDDEDARKVLGRADPTTDSSPSSPAAFQRGAGVAAPLESADDANEPKPETPERPEMSYPETRASLRRANPPGVELSLCVDAGDAEPLARATTTRRDGKRVFRVAAGSPRRGGSTSRRFASPGTRATRTSATTTESVSEPTSSACSARSRRGVSSPEDVKTRGGSGSVPRFVSPPSRSSRSRDVSVPASPSFASSRAPSISRRRACSFSLFRRRRSANRRRRRARFRRTNSATARASSPACASYLLSNASMVTARNSVRNVYFPTITHDTKNTEAGHPAYATLLNMINSQSSSVSTWNTVRALW